MASFNLRRLVDFYHLQILLPERSSKNIISRMLRFMRISRDGKIYRSICARFFNYFKKISKNYCNPEKNVLQ